VLLMTPKVGEAKSLSGLANYGWLKTLKKVARNSPRLFSLGQGTGIAFESDKSRLA